MAVLAAFVAALATGSALASSADSSTIITFSARYAGKAVVKVTDDVADISASGVGKGTIIGASKITGIGKGNTAIQPCVPFTGTGTMAAPTGTKLLFRVVSGSEGCGDEEGNYFSLVGRAAVIKGLGKLKGVRGSLKLTGTYDRGSGSFTVKFTGRLTK